MIGFYLYLLKAILSLGIVYGIYVLCLQKLTFFQWNRWYLLLYSFLAFIVPFMNINKVASVQYNNSTNSIIQQIPSIYQWVPTNSSSFSETNTVHQTTANWTYEQLVLTGMILISLLLVIRLAISILSILKITHGAELLGYVNHCKIIRVPKPLSPFSFSNTIVIGNQTYASDELEKILSHEMIHTRQRHSVDIIFAEILIVLAWWNPFSWLVRKSIRQNLEFIADREVIKQGVDVHPYQMLLLKTMQNPALRITNAFSFSHIKKRIMMMNIKPSHRLQLARFLLIAPAFFVLILLFRSPITNAQESASELNLSTSQLENSEIFAEINKDAEGIVNSDTVYFGGVVIHEETGKPVTKFRISISLNDKILTTLITDQSGKYFYAAPIPQTGKFSAFSWKFVNTEFAPGESGFSIIDSVTQPEFYVNLVAPKKTKRRSVSEPVQISHDQIREWDYSSIAILNNITEKSKSIFDKHKELLAMEKDFLSKIDTLNKTFILYNGWLYWKRMENESWSRLEKPENVMLKLADDTVTYDDVNNWFANHKRSIVSQTPAYKNKGSLLSLEFYKDPFSLPKPPKKLLVGGNYQPTTITGFREEFSEEDAVFINGFRAYRNSQLTRYSDLLSGNENAKTIYKLTGALAAHYSEKASVVWWIETKEVDKVFNRPDFESTKKQPNLTLFQNGTIMPCNYGQPDGVTVTPELTDITVIFSQPEPVNSLTSGKVVSVFELSELKFVLIKHSNGDYITYGNLRNVRVKKGDMVSNGTVLGLPKINQQGGFSITLQYDTPEGAIGCKNCVEAIQKLAADDRQIVKAEVLDK